MKKLFIILTTLFSSFLCFNVKAAVFEPEIDLSLINDKFFQIKEAAENFVKEDETYSDDFIIYIYSNKLYVSFYKLNNTYTPYCTFRSSEYLRCYITTSGSKLDAFLFSNTSQSLFKEGSIAYNQNNIYYKKVNNNSFAFILLYSTLDIDFKKYNGSSSIVYKINDFSSIIYDDNTYKFKTLYMIKKEYDSFLGDKELVHQEEGNVLKSFYTLCIEKIKYLSDVLVGNYIYLSIFVIFIIIFIFILIKRRLY